MLQAAAVLLQSSGADGTASGRATASGGSLVGLHPSIFTTLVAASGLHAFAETTMDFFFLFPAGYVDGVHPRGGGGQNIFPCMSLLIGWTRTLS
jgi:hypothetical protein